MTEQLPRTQYVVSHRPARGFTLIELLVVVGIISVLAAIMLPALGQARSTAKMIKEMSAARQLALALHYYMDDNNGRQIMAMQADALAGSDVMGALGEVLPNTSFMAEAKHRWVFRLAPYVNQAFRGVMYVNEGEEQLPGGQKWSGMGSYIMSLHPSFGLNASGVGGHHGSLGGSIAGINSTTPWFDNEVIFRPQDESVVPGQLLSFASATSWDGVSSSLSYGWLQVNPPNAKSSGDSWPGAPYNPQLAAEYGSLHYRHAGAVVAGFLDGHAEVRKEEAMRDMRIWLKNAAASGDPDYVSPYTDM